MRHEYQGKGEHLLASKTRDQASTLSAPVSNNIRHPTSDRQPPSRPMLLAISSPTYADVSQRGKAAAIWGLSNLWRAANLAQTYDPQSPADRRCLKHLKVSTRTHTIAAAQNAPE